MYLRNKGGITLIALIITIIVLLILAGVSIVAITGENGLIARAQESVMLTKLSEILFNLENDMITAKSDYVGQRFNTTEITNLLRQTFPDKYSFLKDNSSYNSNNIFFFQLENSPIPNLRFSYNGDVYVDNYKRAEIQLSDYFQKMIFENAPLSEYFGSVDLKINDGTLSLVVKPDFIDDSVYTDSNNLYYQGDQTYDFILSKYMKDHSAYLWVNSNNEFVGIGDNFAFMPLGAKKEHNFAAIEPTLETINIYSEIGNKYILFPTVDLQIYDSHLVVEEHLTYFLTNKSLEIAIDNSVTEPQILQYTLGGIDPKTYGILFFDKLPSADVEFTSYLRENYSHTAYGIATSVSTAINSATGLFTETYFISWDLQTIKKSVEDSIGRKTSSIYYIPIIQYYTYDSSSPTNYSEESRTFFGATVKHLDW